MSEADITAHMAGADRHGGDAKTEVFVQRLSLAQRFALAGSFVMISGMFVIGGWVERQIETRVISNTANATALYMESMVSPIAQELAGSNRLSAESVEGLERIFTSTPLGARVLSYKIWTVDGRIVHARDEALIGQRFDISENLRRAASGEVVADFGDLNDLEDRHEREMNLPILEIYSPLRQLYTGDVIAVAEFYERADTLQEDLVRARTESWLFVVLVSTCMAAMMFGIVLRGSATITRQKAALEFRIAELGRLAEQNHVLRRKVQQASGRTAELNERYLRRLSAELHDGPAQLVGLAALRLDSIRVGVDDAGSDDAIKAIRDALNSALRDIRNLCRGLAAPELADHRLHDVIGNAIEYHKRHTGSDVTVTLDAPNLDLDQPQKICIYRFLQEGLINAFRHADGKDQTVICNLDADGLHIVVRDGGPGIDPTQHQENGGGLGLAGLRDRVESLGGTFRLVSSKGAGTQIQMRIDVVNWKTA